MTPAFTSSSLNFPISVSSSLLGKTPASESLLPGTMTMTLMPLSPFCLDGVSPRPAGRIPALLTRRTKLHEIDTLHLLTLLPGRPSSRKYFIQICRAPPLCSSLTSTVSVLPVLVFVVVGRPSPLAHGTDRPLCGSIAQSRLLADRIPRRPARYRAQTKCIGRGRPQARHGQSLQDPYELGVFAGCAQWQAHNQSCATGGAAKRKQRASTLPEPEEETRLRAKIRECCPEHETEFDLALHAGMRRSERYRLRWQDVDLKRNIITLPRSKHGEPRRIQINSIARSALLRLRERGTG